MIRVHYIDDDSTHLEIKKSSLRKRGRSSSVIQNQDGRDRLMNRCKGYKVLNQKDVIELDRYYGMTFNITIPKKAGTEG